ncbi:hypothetical protein GCM10025738_25830 [Microbacterium fluvii]
MRRTFRRQEAPDNQFRDLERFHLFPFDQSGCGGSEHLDDFCDEEGESEDDRCAGGPEDGAGWCHPGNGCLRRSFAQLPELPLVAAHGEVPIHPCRLSRAQTPSPAYGAEPGYGWFAGGKRKLSQIETPA